MDINYAGDLSKTRTCFLKITYVFLEKVVHVFRKTRTCFFKLTIIHRKGRFAYLFSFF